MSKSESASEEYEIQYRSTIQPRTAVRSQSRQSGNFATGGTGGGGGANTVSAAQKTKKVSGYEESADEFMQNDGLVKPRA
ncbi:unnamed protein product [Heligmosomoides polygyrus]|uniref:FoP_duplication domain-containing protein n=1 Tax=Heligmosomoides polygyrus TaxID=6339 RepID=A0A183FE99_HELPZ|nr:unnamed protein product [Heligmosomoides polygyrus]